MAINPSVREINVTAAMYDETYTKVATFTHKDKIKSITIQRTGEVNKFFGFGIVGKMNLKLIDPNREIVITTNNYFNISFENVYDLPYYIVTEVHRDDVTNELSVTGYDLLYFLSAQKAKPSDISAPYTIKDLVSANLTCSNHKLNDLILGNLKVNNSINGGVNWDVELPEGANFDDSYTSRDILNAAAEVTGSIYYVGKYVDDENRKDTLFIHKPGYFARGYELTPDDYFSLKVWDNRRLKEIAHITELGDNRSEYDISITGSTQYIRDNIFLTANGVLEDHLLNALFEQYGGTTMAQFEVEWRGQPNGNFYPGRKIVIHTKDGSTITGYNLNDTITYDGTFRHKIEWKWDTNVEFSADTAPTSIGDTIKKTFAKVDKVNNIVTIVAADNAENSERISQLQLDTQGISASVSSVQKELSEAIEGVNGEITEITKKVELAMTDEQVQIKIDKAFDNGVNNVTTSTGFTFDEVGLTVAKSGSEMKTTITEDGMHIYRDSTEVLIADNEGVWAEDLHATTYLIVGNSSRFEDYTNASGEIRTGCFWIGG